MRQFLRTINKKVMDTMTILLAIAPIALLSQLMCIICLHKRIHNLEKNVLPVSWAAIPEPSHYGITVTPQGWSPPPQPPRRPPPPTAPLPLIPSGIL